MIKEFVHDRLIQSDVVNINRATNPKRGSCSRLEEQKTD